mgnify:CR=1 FL=1|tara:strand:+ start:300 stop:809 length:510 start_codon:yes stop_codon:yes gene_type:complete
MLKIMLKKLMLIFCFAISISNICKADTQIGLEIFKIDRDTNLELSAQSMTFNNQNQEAHFSDDVVVNYGQLKLLAEKLTFVTSKSAEEPNSLAFSASGPITISNKNNFIYGDNASFIGNKQELTIIGNVSLHQNANVIMGDKLILDLEKGVASIIGSVKTIISPNGKIE